MWLLSWLPDFVFHIMLLVGLLGIVASFVLKFIPFVSLYQMPIQVAAILLTVVGVYFEGGISEEAKWQARVNELQAKVSAAETKAAEANTQLEATIAAKNRDIVAAQAATNDSIRRLADKINKTCVVDSDAISILNQAARGVKK